MEQRRILYYLFALISITIEIRRLQNAFTFRRPCKLFMFYIRVSLVSKYCIYRRNIVIYATSYKVSTTRYNVYNFARFCLGVDPHCLFIMQPLI